MLLFDIRKKIVPWDHVTPFNNQLNVYYSTTRFRHDEAMHAIPCFKGVGVWGFFCFCFFFVKTCVYRVAVDWYFIHCIASISLFNNQDRRWRLDFIMYTYLNNVKWFHESCQIVEDNYMSKSSACNDRRFVILYCSTFAQAIEYS